MGIYLCEYYVIYIQLPGQLTAEESLFTYPDGMTFANYAFPNHDPPYLDEVVAAVTDTQILAACGGNKMCIYDAFETDDISIGLDTMETVDRIEEDDKLACKCYRIMHGHCPLFGEYFVQY